MICFASMGGGAMRIKPSEILLLNLEGKLSEQHRLYRTKERAYEQLKHLTGQDFGYDAVAWREWFRTAEKRFRNINKPMNKIS
jgi:hypothetical protein